MVSELIGMTDISAERSLRASDGAIFRELDGEAVILNLDSATYFGLDRIGTRVWQLIEQHGRIDRVIDALAAEYDASVDTLRADVLQLTSTLVEKGLLIVE